MDRDSKRRFGCRRERQIPATVQSIGLPCACWRTGPRPSPSSHRSGDPGLRPMPFLVQPSAGTRNKRGVPKPPETRFGESRYAGIGIPPTGGSTDLLHPGPSRFAQRSPPRALPPSAGCAASKRVSRQTFVNGLTKALKQTNRTFGIYDEIRGCSSPASERAPRHPDDLVVNSGATGPRDQISRRMITDQMAFSRLDPSDTLDDRAVVCRHGTALSCTAMPAAPGHRDRAAIGNDQPHQLAAYADDCAPLRIKVPTIRCFSPNDEAWYHCVSFAGTSYVAKGTAGDSRGPAVTGPSQFRERASQPHALLGANAPTGIQSTRPWKCRLPGAHGCSHTSDCSKMMWRAMSIRMRSDLASDSFPSAIARRYFRRARRYTTLLWTIRPGRVPFHSSRVID